jgi:hypothetical protein
VEIVTVDPVNRTTTFDQVKYCRHRRIVCLRALLARRPSGTGRIAAPQLETTRCWSPSTDNAINGRKSRLSRSNRTCQSLRYSTHAPLSRPRVYSVRDLQIRTSPWSVDRELRSKGRDTSQESELLPIIQRRGGSRRHVTPRRTRRKLPLAVAADRRECSTQRADRAECPDRGQARFLHALRRQVVGAQTSPRRHLGDRGLNPTVARPPTDIPWPNGHAAASPFRRA